MTITHIKHIAAVLLLTAADQLAKRAAAVSLRPVGARIVIPNVLSLTYVENAGAAFGVFEGGRWVFVVTTGIIMAALCFYYLNLPGLKKFWAVRAALALIFAGALGNLIDRLARGYVVDFIHLLFIRFPVFNLADVCVVVGTAALAVLLTFFVKEDEDIAKS
ncbi:MAG: signal peptidase II [Clostridiales bacterium]|jgi:signal peptidase II|nr:signal peptidase II [Clostridiales bacterium]